MVTLKIVISVTEDATNVSCMYAPICSIFLVCVYTHSHKQVCGRIRQLLFCTPVCSSCLDFSSLQSLLWLPFNKQIKIPHYLQELFCDSEKTSISLFASNISCSMNLEAKWAVPAVMSSDNRMTWQRLLVEWFIPANFININWKWAVVVCYNCFRFFHWFCLKQNCCLCTKPKPNCHSL